MASFGKSAKLFMLPTVKAEPIMNAARGLTTADRTRQILEDLEAVRENLLAHSDDIWESSDRQDLAGFDEGAGDRTRTLCRKQSVGQRNP